MVKSWCSIVLRASCCLPLFLALHSPVWAELPPYASATAALTNFRFSVEDLNPGDGAAASVQFLSGAQIQLTAYDSPIFPTQYDFRMLDGAWDSGWPSGTASISGAVASISADGGMKASASLEAGMPLTGNPGLRSAEADALLASAWNPDANRFLLSPYSALILEGSFASSSQLDLAAIAQHPSVAAQDPWTWIYAEAWAQADVTVYQVGSNDILGVARLDNTVSGQWLPDEQPMQTRDPLNGSPSMSDTFRIRIENTSDQALDGMIALTLLSHVQIQVNTAPVPEPGAMPAVLAGGGGVWLMLRWRRRLRQRGRC